LRASEEVEQERGAKRLPFYVYGLRFSHGRPHEEVATCDPDCSRGGLYQHGLQDVGKSLDELPSRGGKVDDVSMILGSPPARCDAVAAPSPIIGARIAQEKLIVVAVVPGGPADQAGLRTGDLISAVAGQAVSNSENLGSTLRNSVRDGQPLQIETNRGAFSVTPRLPKAEQCYWDIQGGQVARSGGSGYVNQWGGSAGWGASSNQQFFRASCRINDGLVAGCQWNWQK
jgi:membrane-associated protease RseP (regulator of RpoE activity)